MSQQAELVLDGPGRSERAQIRAAIEAYFVAHPEPQIYQTAMEAISAEHGFDRYEVMDMFTWLINHGPIVSHTDLSLTWEE